MKLNLRLFACVFAMFSLSILSFSQSTIISWPFGVNGLSSSSVSGNSNVNLAGPSAFYSGVGCSWGQEAISNSMSTNSAWTTGSFNTTGYTSLKYTFRQMSFTGGPTQFKFQYRLSTSGGWTDLTSTYSTPVLGGAGCGTPYYANAVSLPTAMNNQSVVQLRWLCTSGGTTGGGRLASVSITGTASASCTAPTVPTVTASSTTICTGSSTTLNISGTKNDATSWKVYSGSCGGTLVGTVSSGTTLSVSPTSNTTYYVRGEGGCVTAGSCGSRAITVNSLDNASFTYPSGGIYCKNGSDPTPTASTAGTYSSTAGLSINASTGAIDVSASTAATYTVTHTTTGSCPNTAVRNVTINAIDDASFSYGSSSYCKNGSDPTPTAATAGTYSSTSGLSINTSTGTIDVSASTAGTYTVTHTTTDDCPATSTKSVTITDADDASFSYGSSAYCTNASDPTPTAATAGTYSSTAGLSINTSTGTIDVSASTAATYTVTHTTTGSCPNTSTQSVTINALDNPAFAYGSSSYCKNGSDPTPTITGTTGGTFSSTSGLTINASTGKITVSSSTAGSYTVTYVTGGTCSQSSTKSVTITDADDASFSYASSAYCTDGSDPTPTISGLTGGTFSSTTGLSITASSGTIDVSACTAGDYVVTYTTAGTCPSSSTKNVKIHPIENPAFSYASSAYCKDGSDATATITGNTGGTFSSTTGLTINASTGTIDVSASAAGDYVVTYATGGPCSQSTTQNVKIHPIESPAFSYASATYCKDGSDATATITGNTGGTFSSTTGLTINATSGTIDVSGCTPGDYVVTYTTAGPCPQSTTQNVKIHPIESPAFSYASSAYCKDGSDATATITGNTGGTFSSTSGLTINATSGTIDVSASAAGDYVVTYATGGPCSQSTTQNVKIHPIESPAFSYASATYCKDGSDATATITGNTGGTFSSTTGLSINATSGTIDVSACTPGDYVVTYTTAGPCPQSSTQNVKIHPVEVPTFSYSPAIFCDNDSDPTPTITGNTGGSFSSTTGLSINTTTGTIDLSASNGGDYVVTYATGGPCSQSATFTVTVKEVTFKTETITAYETYTSPSGKTWTTSATRNDTLTNAAGCDSVITVELTIINRLKTWDTGNPTLDDIIKAANATGNAVEVWVQEGTYYPGGQSSTNRDSAYLITNPKVSLLGGFSGNETEAGQRNPTANPTVLCGNIGTAGDSSDNAYHVLIIAPPSDDIGSDFVLDGLIIRDGNADGGTKKTYNGIDVYQNEGGGLMIKTTKAGQVVSPTITNCQFENNYGDYGGSVYIKAENGKSFATFSNCTFKNGASIYGAIYNDGQSGEVAPNITNCVFDNNTSETSGAAIYNYGYGGKASPVVTSCVFNDNRAATHGGAIYNNGYAGTSNTVVMNATFHKNEAGSSGGAIYSFGNSGTCRPKVTNAIFHDNTKNGDDDHKFSEFYNYVAYPFISYSSLQRASSTYTTATANSLNFGSNNKFQVAPSFVSTSSVEGTDGVWRTGDDGLRVTGSSSLMNVGTATGAPTNDILGNQRNGLTDMGAYEYVSCGLNVKLATAVKTHTATQTVTDDGFTCYCNSDNELLLALDTNGTGAKITPSQVKLYIGDPSTLSYNSAGGMITNTAGGVILERRWDVDPTTQPTSPVRVRYFYTKDNYEDIVTAMAALTAPTTVTSPSQLQFYKVTGGSTATFPNPHNTGVTGIVLANGTTATTTTWVNGTHGVQDHTAEYLVSSFSGGGGGGGGGSTPLPVELIEFTAQKAPNHRAALTWTTASELNNSHFVVERSYNGADFQEVGMVAGNGTTQNVINYNHTDATIAPTQYTVFYRLRQVDFDGTEALSPIRKVLFEKAEIVRITSIYPNPTKGEVTIAFPEEDEAESHTIIVLDGVGRTLQQTTTKQRATSIDLSNQPSGLYFIQLDTGETVKVIKE